MRRFDPESYPPIDDRDPIEPEIGPEMDPADDGTPVADEDRVERIGLAIGVTYCENEPLTCGDKEQARDAHRWELDPASAEDYRERMRCEHETDLPSEPILHMAHRRRRPGRTF